MANKSGKSTVQIADELHKKLVFWNEITKIPIRYITETAIEEYLAKLAKKNPQKQH